MDEFHISKSQNDFICYLSEINILPIVLQNLKLRLSILEAIVMITYLFKKSIHILHTLKNIVIAQMKLCFC